VHIISHVKIQDQEDELQWIHSLHGVYTPKEGYIYIYANKAPEKPSWWWKPLWKLKHPTKAKLFQWCLLANIIPMGENI